MLATFCCCADQKRTHDDLNSQVHPLGGAAAVVVVCDVGFDEQDLVGAHGCWVQLGMEKEEEEEEEQEEKEEEQEEVEEEATVEAAKCVLSPSAELQQVQHLD